VRRASVDEPTPTKLHSEHVFADIAGEAFATIRASASDREFACHFVILELALSESLSSCCKSSIRLWAYWTLYAKLIAVTSAANAIAANMISSTTNTIG